MERKPAAGVRAKVASGRESGKAERVSAAASSDAGPDGASPSGARATGAGSPGGDTLGRVAATAKSAGTGLAATTKLPHDGQRAVSSRSTSPREMVARQWGQARLRFGM